MDDELTSKYLNQIIKQLLYKLSIGNLKSFYILALHKKNIKVETAKLK